MSSTYSRNSWPYKNIVISFFNSSRRVRRVLRSRERGGARWVREHGGGTGCVCEGTGWMEEGTPHSGGLSLSVPAAATASCP